MKHLLSLCLCAMLLAPAVRAMPPEGLIAGLSGDWNADGMADLATLWAGEDGATLVMYHGDLEGLVPVLVVPEAVYSGGNAGQMPRFSARSDTAFVLHQEQIAIGRTPWMLDLTIAWRPALGGWVVAGYTYTVYDRLDPDAGLRCDVNLLTGSFEREVNGAVLTGSDGPAPLPLAHLTQDWRPAACNQP
jgi:hypothetical protein